MFWWLTTQSLPRQNKTSSAVQLRHIPTGIVVKSQATRSRSQNRALARRLLAQRLDQLHNGDQSRAAVAGQLKKRRADSAAKKSRRKYKKLDEAKADAAAQHERLHHHDDPPPGLAPATRPSCRNKDHKP